ncbi:Polyribonucleotide nucleotidyltransferase [Moorella thermoacetica]|uniref:Polyribonucleotide nucleotidyltransferase n=1 Tax=Neomoorella thermoacetica TaxID=1525 RepID=A0AAC9HH60_NEOTH|nr:polyribonucleotide nucleotidyltransferase [Moorella thermoacetica]AOQ23737.1 Polyribonucleotide nucleotidyltransferase [Moorella thermoacetica]TYL13922.1 Polyribonucleotide nucleotidyltransferase [Moorella thermoacetica]
MQGVLRKTLVVAGRDLTLETGRLAKQAGGAVMVSYGGTMVLVTATASEEPREGIDFFPLTVDYEERLYAAGKIPGGFIKREGRPSEKAILSARLIDRPIRPLFPKFYRNDVHVVATVMSVDQDCPPNVAGIIGASAALMLSAIPFAGPIGAVSVGLIDNRPVINPTLEEDSRSSLNLTVAGTANAIMMVEAGAKEVPEDLMLECIMQGHEEIKRIVAFINEFRAEALAMGLAKEKPELVAPQLDPAWESRVREIATPRLREVIYRSRDEKWSKQERDKQLDACREEINNLILEGQEEALAANPELPGLIKELITKIEKEIVRRMILTEGIRVDGRTLEEIRPITCEVGVLSRTHGSGLFTRGETQVLTVTTLGPISDEQILDDLGVDESKRYMHHYNFPPYSVGEARPIRAPGRREIGHGALAERALEPMIPSEEEFPYAIRLVSEVLGSNGSTSMGSVCGSTLSLMDAGVPIKAPVAGVAMGLVKENDQVAILTDIQGLEDALGDMDFKVAGTKNGITALQMDIKIAGIDRSILERALEQARRGRLFILEKILATIPEPRKELSPYAPRMLTITIDPDKIRDIIGPGGKIIKKIIEETGVEIDVEDDGRVFIASTDAAAGERALKIIESLTQDVETGKVYNGKVTRVTDFGAFVEVIPGVLGMPGKEGLVHISQLANERVEKVEDVVQEGDYILVKAIGFDPQGRLKLSRKEALNESTVGEGGHRHFRRAGREGGHRGLNNRRQSR